ncbi:MAG TPA: hypothetical protein VKV57_05730 [bacterium]|nr:hypothetical protein [bacterium]
MDATPQLAMAAALTMRVRNPFTAFGIGLGSHVVLDAIPHYHVGWIAGATGLSLADLLLGTGLALAMVAMSPAPWGSIVGALGGAAPELERLTAGGRYDFFEAPPFNFPHATVGLPWGLLTQAAATLFAVGIAIRFRRVPAPGRTREEV